MLFEWSKHRLATIGKVALKSIALESFGSIEIETD